MNTTTQQDTQAAANKAAEEGGLPALPKQSLLRDGMIRGVYGYGAGDMAGYARQAIAADRASLQVEVRTTDRNYAEGSPHNICRAIERDLREELARQVANKAEVEPAVHVAPSVNSEKFRDLLYLYISDTFGGNSGEQARGFKALIAHIDQHVAREVAAQAGQVAVPEDVLRVLRRLLDGSQPQDVPGAVMAIDAALAGGAA